MSLDHGTLNVPLAKRGNIDSQIDAYKDAQARVVAEKRKEDAAVFKAQKAAAKIALAEILAAPGLVDAKAAKFGCTRRDLLAQLDGWAKWRPAFLIRLHADWLPEVVK